MKIMVDPEKCIGCGTCCAIAAKSFRLNVENKAEPIVPPGDDAETIDMAIESCPTQAISK